MKLPALRTALAKGLRRLEGISRGTEIVLFILVAAAAADSRALFAKLLPTYLWSKDTGSYAHGAFEWLNTGEWMIDGRRGPVYSMFLGHVARVWGSFDGVMVAQHLIECVAILFTVLCARVHLGPRRAWLVYLCGYALAVYGIGMHMGHVLRVESLLFFLASMALSSWSLAIRGRSAGWLACAGLMAGLLTLTKNVFLPFPIIALAGVVYLFRRTPTRLAMHAITLLAAFALPFGLYTWHNKTARWVDDAKPQSGILLYGRTAQWTVLDGGIEPELKAVIRTDIADYRKLGKLDNNVIIKDTAVPHLWMAIRAQGKSPADLDKLCRRFALEAMRAQPRAYISQALHDVWRMQVSFGMGAETPEPGELKLSSRLLAEMDDPPPILHAETSQEILASRLDPNHFKSLARLQRSAWLFQKFPVLLTTLGVLWLLWRSRGEERLLWLGHAALWFFTMLLLSTIGRPLNRYLIPVVPVMFWTLTAALAVLFTRISDWLTAENNEAEGQ